MSCTRPLAAYVRRCTGRSILLLCLCCPLAAAQLVESLEVGGESPIVYQRFAASGDRLLVWWPSEHGLNEGLQRVASTLAAAGVEVWIADPFTTWFLPTLSSSLDEIPRERCGSFLRVARAETQKRLFVIAHDRGARVLLECLRHAQQQGLQQIDGVVLVTPDLYTHTPRPGRPGTFAPVARATNLPVFAVFTEKSVQKLYRDDIIAALTQGGSRVYHTFVDDARNRYFFRPDASPQEQQAAGRLPQILSRALELLDRDDAPQPLAPLREDPTPSAQTGTTRKLVAYTGTVRRRELVLPGLDGRTYALHEQRGKVVLVSFWATWCPPCVHELPSMVRLQSALADQPFQVLAVNLGEDAATIDAFLRARPVNFPVLLDAQSQEAQQWEVFAFPSSFLLDRQGVIRFGVAGALEWDDPAVIDTVTAMLAER